MSLYLADALFICIKLSPVDGEKSFPFASRNIPIMKPGINETQKPTIFGVSPSNGKHPVKISAASVKLGDRHLDVVPLTVEDAHVAFECTPTYEVSVIRSSPPSPHSRLSSLCSSPSLTWRVSMEHM